METNVAEMFGTETGTETLERSAAQLAEFIAVEEAEIERLKKSLTERSENLDNCKEQLATLLQQAGLQSIKLKNGLAPRVQEVTKYFKAPGVDDDMLFSWLAQVGLGDIIKPYVHFGTLQSALKEHVAGGNALPENIINTSQRLTVRMNGKTAFLSNRNAETPAA
jgi:uncharacterized small protein (DUF1192 family)